MIIGLTGSFGAGKGAAVEYLVKEKRFRHFSARALIREEVEKAGMPVNRDTLIELGNTLRKLHGPAYIAQTLLKRAQATRGSSVIESLRATAEAEYIQHNGGVVLGIDADPRLRYERAVKRGTETDHVSYDKWKDQQKVETNPTDKTKQDVFAALKKSDHIIMNNGTLEELHAEIEKFLATAG